MKLLLFTLAVSCLCFLVAEGRGDEKNENLLFKLTQKAQPQRKYRDCHERWKYNGETEPGVYTIHPNGTHPVQVYCQHSINATYTVIQRRLTGTESFVRDWHSYKVGFGNPQGDYWIGLDNINYLTTTGNNILRVDMQDWYLTSRYAQYQHFLVNNEYNYYRMTISGFSGNVPDDLAFQNGMYFYTYDRPDQYGCATNQQAGWWYNYCSYGLLNGKYYFGGPYQPSGQFYDGIYWKDWRGYAYSLKFVTMTLYK